MSYEQPNLLNAQVAVGAEVQLLRNLAQTYRLNTHDRFSLEAGEVFTVTRIYAETLQVRTVETKTVTETRNYSQRQVQRQVSFQIDRMHLAFRDPNYVPPPPPRKLGTTPKYEDLPNLPPGASIISIDHPGIQWLFDDMGAYAEREGYCPQYDVLCARLGIPGRPRNFKVTKTIGGIPLSADIKARSQKEANELVEKALAGRLPDLEEKVGLSDE